MTRAALRLLVLLAAATASPGCLVLSVASLYDADSIEVDDRLVGTWEARDRSATAVVERGEWKSYRITYSERAEKFAFVGHLTKVRDDVFLDLAPLHGVESMPLLVPVHGFARVRHSADTLSLAPIDYDWLRPAVLAKKAGRLDAAFDARQNVLATSPTAVVRAWLAELKSEDAFREPVEFVRAR